MKIRADKLKLGDVIRGWEHLKLVEVTLLDTMTLIVVKFPDNHLETYDILSSTMIIINDN